jgi:enterochelin esterase-like enzyme
MSFILGSKVALTMALLGLSCVAVAQTNPPAPTPEQTPPQAPRPQRVVPKPGPVALPILPALPRSEDISFYAHTDVPHGKVVQATYKNFAGKEKRMHIYLPPDYDTNTSARYPVLYLNHGGGEDDAKWTAIPPGGGQAHDILDNLIAAGKAKPMIVVMPNTRELASPRPPVPGQLDDCSREYLQDIIPYVDKQYRTKATRENRALAGLSMGGFVVMNTGLAHLDTFSELYVYSSGYFPEQLTAVEENFKAILQDPRTNESLLRVPLYMAEGETDIALKNGQATLSIFNRYGLRNFWVLSSGGHEWKNWRRYLWQTAQVMFPDSAE